jgi:MOSC domain-containing protein YiiM
MNPDPVQKMVEDSSPHLSFDVLERGLATLAPPKDVGTLALIVARGDHEQRETPPRVMLTPQGGVPGDAWARKSPQKIDAQITVMRADVARLFANGQPLSLFGDNLLVDLDVSLDNLPTGSRLRLGTALLEVTPEPHTGCAKFKRRVGEAALRLTADPRYRPLRLRGIYVKVVETGEAAVGDAIEVLSRG